MYILYSLWKAMQVCSMVLIICTIISLFINWWQKKYDKENANYTKGFTKFLVRSILIGVTCLIASSICLFLRIY